MLEVKLAPEYDWKISVWKGLRPALTAALTAAIVVFFSALEPDVLVKLGIPASAAVFILESVRNYLKQVYGKGR